MRTSQGHLTDLRFLTKAITYTTAFLDERELFTQPGNAYREVWIVRAVKLSVRCVFRGLAPGFETAKEPRKKSFPFFALQVRRRHENTATEYLYEIHAQLTRNN